MDIKDKTLGELLGEKSIAPVAADAIRDRDLSAEPVWGMTLNEVRSERFFSGEIAEGFKRLYKAAAGEWFFPLDNGDGGESAHLVWLPSDDSRADDRPFILIVPGGGFVNVWNLTEGWPIAAQFNALGYHAFVLTYHVRGDRLLERDMQDFAAALRFIKDNEKRFRVDGGRYITCGFSAGGYLVCLWNTDMGYPAFGLPKPRAVFPVYPVTGVRYTPPEDEESAYELFGCSTADAAMTVYETTEHAEGFPPCALFLAEDDGLVSPENSRALAAALERHGIPCRIEAGPEGGHGFADGSGMCMAGWTERAVAWYEAL
ncbi:MAG: alpha/beta hydrolase [Oscillospiraceae bacterium]|nr:alpha/beta hydrolase [Oscillospiraceae bacterium]